MKILIADDDVIPRRLLEAALVRAGHEVVTTRDGMEAWQALQSEGAPRLAILDWLMPGMDGPEVCRRVRERANVSYIYLILLSAKVSKEDVVIGMEAGADDYLTKPFDPHELQVRVRAGQRIIELEVALRESLADLAKARRREAQIGARIQQMLLLGRPPEEWEGTQIAAISIPSQQIDGDFYDFFSHPDRCLDVVVGDVMGKGPTAALLAAAIKSQLLRGLGREGSPGSGLPPEPEEVVERAHLCVTEQLIQLESFVTLCYARFDLTRQRVLYVDCGHTKTIHFRRATGECEMLQGGNMPLGASAEERYQQVEATFERDDLFFFYSDGVTEARATDGELFGVARLIDLVKRHGNESSGTLVDRVHRAVIEFSGCVTFADDLTCVAVRVGGA